MTLKEQITDLKQKLILSDSRVLEAIKKYDRVLEKLLKTQKELDTAKETIVILQQTIKDLSPASITSTSSIPYLQDMLGKANLKMKMSKEAQEYAIANGCVWYGSTDNKSTQHLGERFLYIRKNKRLTFGNRDVYYNSISAIEVQFDPSRPALTTCEPCQS